MAAGQELRPLLLQTIRVRKKLSFSSQDLSSMHAAALMTDLEYGDGVAEVGLGAVQVSREALLQAAEALP
jgi:hypothetical protein